MTTATQPRGFDLKSLRCAAGTDVGMRREDNQDSFGVIRHEAFQAFFVADGMGGVSGGAIASRLAISTLQEELPTLGAIMSPESLTALVSSINNKIFERGTAEPALAGMGTTLVGIVFTAQGLISLNIGDSRAYLIRDSFISQLSEDHTIVRELVRSGAISSSDASHHPVSHLLTRSLGPLPEVEIECRYEINVPQQGDIYVLCSDGLYNFVQDDEILDVVRRNPLDDASQILINLANRRGGADNITVVVISVGETGGKGGRGSPYRNARSATASELPLARESSRGATVEESKSGPSEFDDPHVVLPPVVEEPRDLHAERESLKRRVKLFQYHRQGMPVTILVIVAVVFGLVAGDVARRWSIFPEMRSWFNSHGTTVAGEASDRQGSAKLSELLKELARDQSSDTSPERLSEIARKILGDPSHSSLPRVRGIRRDLLLLNKETLERASAKIEEHLKSLDLFSVREAEDKLSKSRAQLESFNREISEIDNQIDASARKLSLWFGRKKKLEEGSNDTFKPDGEFERVGAMSESVRKKLAEWTEATYRLQAKQDEFELYPGNEILRRAVEGLTRSREELLSELRNEVSKTIEGVLADTNQKLEVLRVRKDIVAAQFGATKEEIDLYKALADPDGTAREMLRKRLQEELSELATALQDINHGP